MADKKCASKCDVGIAMDETPKLKIGGKDIGIACLDDVMSEVQNMDLKDEGKITKELMIRVKERDFIPSKVEKEYATALLAEYKRRCN
ncbi:MAG: hypothetical protein WCK39_06270 [Methanomassiliicoccales archaeon]